MVAIHVLTPLHCAFTCRQARLRKARKDAALMLNLPQDAAWEEVVRALQRQEPAAHRRWVTTAT